MSANYVGLWTLVKREMKRSLKIVNQVIWPPIITTILYVTIFGIALGSRIKNVQGVSYSAFLVPGLIMMQVIDSSYGESSSSIFQGRFMQAIQEMLIAPMSAIEMLVGYVGGSVIRAFLIANIIMLLGMIFVHVVPVNWPLYFVLLLVVSVLFSSLGVIFGLMAEKFDHLAVLTTFAITPLVFVGGVFTSIHFMPPFVARISLFNPIFYTIDAFRYTFTGQSDVPLEASLAVISVMTILAFGIAWRLLALGHKLRV